MKFLKRILLMTLLLLNNTLIYARTMGALAQKPSAQPKSTPVMKKPAVQPVKKPSLPTKPVTQPSMQPRKESYKDLVALIKNNRNAWNASSGMLNANFVATIQQKARDLNLQDFQLEALLQTARDMHGIFSGNQKRDIAILQAVDQQIAQAVQQL